MYVFIIHVIQRWVVAASCLLLAGKVEETPKKCKDILKVAQSILTEQQMANFGSNPKEELLTHERILLQTIKFDLQVQHPYAFLLKYAKALRGNIGILINNKYISGRFSLSPLTLPSSLLVQSFFFFFFLFFPQTYLLQL